MKIKCIYVSYNPDEKLLQESIKYARSVITIFEYSN
jgi:hypothetical protein